MRTQKLALGMVCGFVLGIASSEAQLFLGTYYFDENGNTKWLETGSWQQTGLALAGGGVQYSKIATAIPFSDVGATYGWTEPDPATRTTVLSDLIHIDSPTTFSFYSDPGDSDWADVVGYASLEEFLRVQTSWTAPITYMGNEIGFEGDNHVEMGRVFDPNGDSYTLYGISDVPEPSPLIFLGVGLFNLIGYHWYRRSSKA